ncbi:MAG: methyltransferase domain-containing protein [Paludibaculum sp.]
MHAQSHRSDARTLGRRTLEADHRQLARLLRPGLSVLDVGCGVGAITLGIAKAVAPDGQVLGVDRDPNHVEASSANAAQQPNLRFELGDGTDLPYRAQFDVVTSARTLQWIADPARAVAGMVRAAKRGGLIVILDYDHEENRWDPAPPSAFQHFYQAFLAWRHSHHWDNRMASHLPGLLEAAGLVEVVSYAQNEVTERGEPDFPERSTLWIDVIRSVGTQLVQDGFCTEIELELARSGYKDWVDAELTRQTLAMQTVTGRVP